MESRGLFEECPACKQYLPQYLDPENRLWRCEGCNHVYSKVSEEEFEIAKQYAESILPALRETLEEWGFGVEEV